MRDSKNADRVDEISSTWAAHMTHFLSALSKMPSYDGKVFRGTSDGWEELSATYWVGRQVRWSGVTSTSTKQSQALLKAGDAGTVFVITVRHGKEVAVFSEFPMEDEVILVPNMTFVVTGPVSTELVLIECDFLDVDVVPLIQIVGDQLVS